MRRRMNDVILRLASRRRSPFGVRAAGFIRSNKLGSSVYPNIYIMLDSVITKEVFMSLAEDFKEREDKLQQQVSVKEDHIVINVS